MANPFGVLVVHELKIALPKLEYGDVGRSADPQRPQFPERRNRARRVDGPAGDHPLERHPEHQEFR